MAPVDGHFLATQTIFAPVFGVPTGGNSRRYGAARGGILYGAWRRSRSRGFANWCAPRRVCTWLGADHLRPRACERRPPTRAADGYQPGAPSMRCTGQPRARSWRCIRRTTAKVAHTAPVQIASGHGDEHGPCSTYVSDEEIVSCPSFDDRFRVSTIPSEATSVRSLGAAAVEQGAEEYQFAPFRWTTASVTNLTNLFPRDLAALMVQEASDSPVAFETCVAGL